MTHMAREIAEAPAAVARFLDHNGKALEALGERLRKLDPPFAITVARGSSDHAATYFAYLAEIALGIPCASIGPSVVSVFGAKLKAKGALSLTISQSGKSPDIVSFQSAMGEAGALTVALVNDEHSPAAKSADVCLPLCAGPELSVAATKSFIVSAAGAAALVAHWSARADLIKAVASLPEALAKPLRWNGLEGLADSIYVLGRGPSLAMAAETALKLKETCAVHAEAFSVAEVMHGPLEIIEPGFPVVTFEAAEKVEATGARVLHVPSVDTGSLLLDPIAKLMPVYVAIEAASRARGRDPDAPRHLRKVTETV